MRTRIVTKAIPDEIPPLRDEQLVELAEILRLLGEPSRLRIVLACLACLARPAPVGEIARRAAIPSSLVSIPMRADRSRAPLWIRAIDMDQDR